MGQASPIVPPLISLSASFINIIFFIRETMVHLEPEETQEEMANG